MPIQVGEEVSIVGSYKHMLYEADNFYIISVDAPYDPFRFPVESSEKRVEFVAKGRFSTPDYVGQTLEFVGEWRFDQKYKAYTLSVQYTIPSLPKTSEGTISFLKSVRGIGNKIAARICDEFKGNLQNVTLDEDWLTASIKGVTRAKAAALCGAIRRINSVAELTKLLRDMVPGDTIRRISVKYGSKALDMATGSPYKMVDDRAIPFKEADAVALALGWGKDDETRLRAGIISSMRGIKARTSSIIVDKQKLLAMAIQVLGVTEDVITQTLEQLYKERLLVSAASYCYLVEDYLAEKELSKKIVDFSIAEVPPSEVTRYLNKFEEWKAEHPQMVLADKQSEGVKAVAAHQLSIITGGPGTGKTATLKAIMETYRKAYPKSNITLMAPTGLASKRMSEACALSASTIHKTLGLIPADTDAGFDDSDGLSIDGGLVIIDEFSMVDIYLSRFLLDAIMFAPDTRIVIVGDVDQLPSVSAGAVLDAMIASGEVKVTRLDRNFRQEAGSAIIDAAHAINAGDKNLQLNVGNFQFREISNKDITVETAQILEEVKRAFVWSMKHFGLEQTYVLAPQRKAVIKDKQTTPETLLSTQSLNPILRDIANPPAADKAFYKSGSRVFRVGDRVMNRKNTLEVLNGEIGYIKKIETIDVPVITVDYDGIEVEYTPDRLKQLDLAYAVTVHKSQGCEYDSVIYPTSLVQGMMLQRNLLYTAVTRAKRNVLILGSKESIDKAIQTKGSKSKRDLLAARIIRTVQNRKDAQKAPA